MPLSKCHDSFQLLHIVPDPDGTLTRLLQDPHTPPTSDPNLPISSVDSVRFRLGRLWRSLGYRVQEFLKLELHHRFPHRRRHCHRVLYLHLGLLRQIVAKILVICTSKSTKAEKDLKNVGLISNMYYLIAWSGKVHPILPMKDVYFVLLLARTRQFFIFFLSTQISQQDRCC
ncbi:uncharacterized protein LOC129288626 [Prosopis cineraria]|uniref:uncharacterized protein LOC129288626 n=1 Tax=Prosopis cineraria TaxID=364024 RepID=UPI00240F74A1|nr:uncharacterized protein LOC129288626 [Prosopis cineraria]